MRNLPDFREFARRGRAAWRTRPRLSTDLAFAVLIAVALILFGWFLSRSGTVSINIHGSGGTGEGIPLISTYPTAPTDGDHPGQFRVGDTLTADNGTWTNNPTSYTYQWYDENTAIVGATSSTYQLQSSDVDHTVDVSVTAHNGSGDSVPAPSLSAGVTKNACNSTTGDGPTAKAYIQNTDNAGKTECLTAGTYTMGTITVIQPSMTTLEADPAATADSVILSGTTTLSNVSNLRFEGFNSTTGGFQSSNTASHIKIVNYHFHDCASNSCGSIFYGLSCAGCGDVTVSHSNMQNVTMGDGTGDDSNSNGISGCGGSSWSVAGIYLLYNTFVHTENHPIIAGNCPSPINIIGNEMDDTRYTSSIHTDCIEVWAGSGTTTIRDNRCLNNQIDDAGDFLLSADSGPYTVTNNVVSGPQNKCVDVEANGTNPANVSNMTFENNTVINCFLNWNDGGWFGSGGVLAHASGTNGSNNTVRYNVLAGWSYLSADEYVLEDYNDVVSSTPPYRPGTHDIATEPTFAGGSDCNKTGSYGNGGAQWASFTCSWQNINLPGGTNWGYQPARVGYQANIQR